jgi:zinc transporter
MNVGGVPLADDPYGFWIIFGVVIGFTVVAGCIAIRRQGND